MNLRGITVCVEYSDILSLTLPYNRCHFSEYLVVTKPDDIKTIQVAVENECRTFVTNAFYEDGAHFAKWRALEEGLTCFGREGWMAVVDADVLWPKEIDWSGLEVGKLYTPKRRMFPTIPKSMEDVPPESDWHRYELHRNFGEWAGYSHVLNAGDPAAQQVPWYETWWSTAGGADSFFQRRWTPDKKVRPNWECLHLGPAGANWAGRATAYADGTKPPEADQRLATLKRLMRLRGRNPRDRFHFERVRKG